jgi:predicted alpha/beta superfamily hydrolase
MTELIVRVPPESPADAQLFLAGNLPEFGSWQADGIPLNRRDTGSFTTTLDIPPERHLDYLITCGSWRMVESLTGGAERRPRRLTATARVAGITVANWGRHSIRYHHNFYSEHLRNQRTISVYVPPGYDEDSSRHFPVLYMHDGQNLFDAVTAFGGVPWGADETADRLIRANRIRPLILVGVANTRERIREYGPTGRRARGTSRSYRYGRFLVEELKPFIDRTYRTAPGTPNTGVGGSSMGGLISLFLARWYPDVFGLCMAMSPSLWWDRELVLRSWPSERAWLRGLRFWIDMGTDEGGTSASRREQVRRVRRLAHMLERSGLRDGREFHYLEVEGGQHNERDWGARFESALEFFFGNSPN